MHIATHCDTLQHTAALCNTLHRVPLAVTKDNTHEQHPFCVHTTPRYNTLQRTAAHHNKLQHISLAVAKKNNRTKRSFFFFDGYCSTVQGLLDWFEVDLGFTELSFIQIDLCVLCVFVLYFRLLSRKKIIARSVDIRWQ